MSVCRPSWIDAQPVSCAVVGASNASANHRAVIGWKLVRDMCVGNLRLLQLLATSHRHGPSLVAPSPAHAVAGQMHAANPSVESTRGTHPILVARSEERRVG